MLPRRLRLLDVLLVYQPQYRTCLDYTPASNKRPPPLRGLSYCAGFLSRKHAPALTRTHIRVCLLDRARIREYTCMRL